MVPGFGTGVGDHPIWSTAIGIAGIAERHMIPEISSVVHAISRPTAILGERKNAALIVLVLCILPLMYAVIVNNVPQESPFPPEQDRLARVLANSPPYFAQNLGLYLYPTVDVPFSMGIKVADSNNDTVNVTWEWGDNSPNATDITPPASLPVWVNQTHIWSIPREPGVGDYYSDPYLVNITLDDGMGGVTRTQRNAYVYIPPNGIPELNLSAPEGVDPSDPAPIVASATDPEGDPLTWTFVFNDSAADFRTEVFHTPATAPNETVWNNISYVFGVEGNYTVRLNVSDALPPNQIWPHNISLTVPIKSMVNHPPQVVGVIDASPQPLIINATIGYLVVEYSVEAFDPDGDVVYLDWSFNDGGAPATNESTGGTQVHRFVQARNYTDAVSVNVSVVVGDGRPGHNVSLSAEVRVTSSNLPPGVVGFDFKYSENRSFGLPNETIYFTINLTDPELNAIEVIVDFGDNSTVESFLLTDYNGPNATLILNHSYGSPGEYQITIWYSDNKMGLFEHSKFYNVTVTIKVLPPIVHRFWTTWDYVSLSLFACAFILPLAWALLGMQRRKRIDREGR